MSEMTAGLHPLFDPASLYRQMRDCVYVEDKMRGYLHFLWARAKHATEPLSVPPALSREESLALANWLSGAEASVRSAAGSPDGKRFVTGGDGSAQHWDANLRVLDVWRAPTVLVVPGLHGEWTPSESDFPTIGLCLVREADGQQTLGCRERLGRLCQRRGAKAGRAILRLVNRRCRAFILEPEVVARFNSLLGDGNWLDAFRADTIADNFDVARSLACAPEMDGTVQQDDIVLDRIPVPECYDTLPPRKEPPQVVIVFDHPSGAA